MAPFRTFKRNSTNSKNQVRTRHYEFEVRKQKRAISTKPSKVRGSCHPLYESEGRTLARTVPLVYRTPYRMHSILIWAFWARLILLLTYRPFLF